MGDLLGLLIKPTYIPTCDFLLIWRLNDYDECLELGNLQMMKRYSWYLSSELAALALFSDEVSTAQKVNMVETMTLEPWLSETRLIAKHRIRF